jgi:anti-anti-sigma regulatory factor
MSRLNHIVENHLVGHDALGLARELSALPLEQATGLTLSLRNVAVIDASGVAALVRLYSQFEAAGKVLDLVDVSASVFHELERVGIDACISVDAAAPTRSESRSKPPPPGGAGRFMRWLNPTTTIH